MGTHISKGGIQGSICRLAISSVLSADKFAVKSIDLDMWTPEQMEVSQPYINHGGALTTL